MRCETKDEMNRDPQMGNMHISTEILKWSSQL